MTIEFLKLIEELFLYTKTALLWCCHIIKKFLFKIKCVQVATTDRLILKFAKKAEVV